MRKRVGLLALFTMAVFAVGLSSAHANGFFLTTVPIRSPGQFIHLGASWDSLGAPTANSVGGEVRYYICKSTDTLNIGDAVFFDTLNAVSKSVTLANYNKFAGVVVGGRSTSMQASIASADVGSRACLPNRPVIVLKHGRAWMQVDTQVAGLTAGTGVRPSTFTAGLIQARTTAIDSLYRIIGRSINGGAASAKVVIEVNAK